MDRAFVYAERTFPKTSVQSRATPTTLQSWLVPIGGEKKFIHQCEARRTQKSLRC